MLEREVLVQWQLESLGCKGRGSSMVRQGVGSILCYESCTRRMRQVSVRSLARRGMVIVCRVQHVVVAYNEAVMRRVVIGKVSMNKITNKRL